MMSTPIVMMATENSGSPIIGRMKIRSTISPTTAVATTANSAEETIAPRAADRERPARKVEHGGERGGQKSADCRERSVGEVDHLGGLEDQDETKCQKCIDRSESQRR